MTGPISRLLDRKGRHVETVPETATVCDAVKVMNERKIGAVLVGDLRSPAGIFTERDVLVRVISPGRDPRHTVVRDVMTRTLITLTPNTTVNEAMELVTRHRCRHLPVLDESGICGLISSGDLTSWVVHDQQQMIDDLHGYIRAS